MSVKSFTTQKQLPKVEHSLAEENALVVLPQSAQDVIDFMHSKTPKGIEWGGMIAYKVDGDLTNPSELTLEVVAVMPMNIGSSSLTEYSPSEHIVEMWEAYPELEEGGVLYGAIHSHHNMETFFSATDMSDLENNSKEGWYLSLIVNYAGEYNAKIGATATESSTVTRSLLTADGSATETTTTETSKVLRIVKCVVARPQIELVVPSWLTNKAATLNAKRVPTLKRKAGKGLIIHPLMITIAGNPKAKGTIKNATKIPLLPEEKDAYETAFCSEFLLNYEEHNKIQVKETELLGLLEEASEFLDTIGVELTPRARATYDALDQTIAYLEEPLNEEQYDLPF